MEPKVIRELSPFEDDWFMKVRVARKGSREAYSRADRTLEIVRLILIDQEGNKIQATLFNEIIDRFEKVLESGKSDIIRNAKVRHVNERYQNVNDKIELSFKSVTEVEEIIEHITDIISAAYVQFNDLSKYADGSRLLDFLGMVVKVRPPFIVHVKKPTERTTLKREVTLIDTMGNTIKLILWGDLANNEGKILEDSISLRAIVAALNVRAGYYEDALQLSTTNVSVIEINPKIKDDEAIIESIDHLLGAPGFDKEFGPTKRLTNAIVVTLAEIITSSVDKLYCAFIGKIIKVQNKSNPWYETCSKCNSRVYPEGNNQTATCTKCGHEKLPFTRRYLLKLIISDGVEEVFATLFDAAETIVGCSVGIYADSILTVGKKEVCNHYKTLVLSEDKEFKFLVKMDVKKIDERARKRLIIEEVHRIVGDSNDGIGQSMKKPKRDS